MEQFIKFDIYRPFPELTAAFSTKEGGVSKGIYESMNLSLSSEDDIANVKENYRRFAEMLNLPLESFVVSKQEHTDNIRITGEKDSGKGILKDRDYTAVDGLITDERGVTLCLLFADCLPVYLYDPIRHVIALLHSGWKGTSLKISGKGVKMMHDIYDSDPSDIKAVIGPGICRDCYEVSKDLIPEFKKTFGNKIDDIFKPGRITEENEQKYQLDLKKAVRITLAESGLSEDNIYDPGICTCCEHEHFFSHRYTKGRRGNNAAVLCQR